MFIGPHLHVNKIWQKFSVNLNSFRHDNNLVTKTQQKLQNFLAK